MIQYETGQIKKRLSCLSIILAISGCASNTKSNILTPTVITASSHDGNGPDQEKPLIKISHDSLVCKRPVRVNGQC